jgi:hypothetical protein
MAGPIAIRVDLQSPAAARKSGLQDRYMLEL